MKTLPLSAVLCGLALSAGLFAQEATPKLDFPAASPAATFKQRVGITDVSVEYSRPSARGRRVFGELVPYGEVWRTGANSATKITFSTPVKFGGTDVPAGTYALFTIPGEGEWTVILNNVPGQWGSYAYDASNDVARVKAAPVLLGSPVETFGIGFSDLSKGNAVTLYLVWEKLRVPVKIETDLVGMLAPRIEKVMQSDAEKKPYVQAAMFYYENNLDLDKAAQWMDAGLALQPDAFWLIYRKGLILAKKGDKSGALAAANKSIELARTAPNTAESLRAEYVRLNEDLIGSLN